LPSLASIVYVGSVSNPERIQVNLREGSVRDVARLQGHATVAAIGRLIGKSESYTSRLLKGERPCSWPLLITLATALNVEPTTIAEIRTKVAA
jgi:hypothetical protein